MALRNRLAQSPSPSLPTTPKPGSKHLSYDETNDACEIHNVVVLPRSQELVTLHDSLRNASTELKRFTECSDRLSDMLVQHALSLLPSSTLQPNQVLCGVTIAGQGSRLERSLKSALPSASLGALTIESHANTSEPLLCHVDLPSELCRDREQASEAKVLLLDSQVGTGAAAIMALRVLLDHGVMEEAIILVCFVCSRRGGCRALSAAFPKVRIVTSAVDEGLEHLLTDGHTSLSVEQAGGDRQPWTSFLVS